MKILKFGGKSLGNGKGIKLAIDIIKGHIKKDGNIGLVLSARGKSTDLLLELLDLAVADKSYEQAFNDFKAYQVEPIASKDVFKKEFALIKSVLQGVSLLGDCSPKIKDLLLSQGELIAVQTVNYLLSEENISSEWIDTRNLIKTDNNFGEANVKQAISKKRTQKAMQQIAKGVIPIFTGFIASNETGETTTLGRNGTNYSASLIANYIDATEVISYTNVDGVFTGDPKTIPEAQIIEHLSFAEASEMASFGTSVLHPKTVEPIEEKNIPLRILNSFNLKSKGTLINNKKKSSSIKSISVQKDVSLISVKGKNFSGTIGIDSRIFGSLGANGVNIGIISQGTSEREVSFIVSEEDAQNAVEILKHEFTADIERNEIYDIIALDEMAIITIVGNSINDFAPSLSQLKQNNIRIELINNTLSGANIGLVINKKDLTKATHLIHSQIFGAVKTFHIAIIGKGTVGGTLIDQIVSSQGFVENRKNIRLKIFAIAGSKSVLLNHENIGNQWKKQFKDGKESKHITKEIIDYAIKHNLENLIAIDNTASHKFVENYELLVENGFDLISSNKIANTLPFKDYKNLRELTSKHKKEYLYETNVGAGLPIIDTIKLLHLSGENITRIKGVFSGSLSYLFNAFSESDMSFSHFVLKAKELGYTEPDPREDLSGNDVARKLLILARELDLENEFEDIDIENLVPEHLQEVSKGEFLERLTNLDETFNHIKNKLPEGHVLRYIGDLSGDLQQTKGKLSVKLEIVPKSSALGNLKGADSLFEIYTESYGYNPISIMGAGAGAKVTARGVFGDILRIVNKY